MSQAAKTVGAITQLRRYPVKSMRGEQVNQASLTERGILGDRVYGLLDVEKGHIVSAKHPRKWATVLACQAEYVHEPKPHASPAPIRISLPDERVVSSDDPDVDRILSEAFGREVKLLKQSPQYPTREANRADVDKLLTDENIKEERMAMAAPDGTFFDHAPVHILTTATLTKLGELCPTATFDVRRFRPNIVIEALNGDVEFVENEWLGKNVLMGEISRLHLIDPTPRCVITTLGQGDLPRDLDVLRTIARYTSAVSMTAAPGHVLTGVVGVYGVIDTEGLVRRMDGVDLIE